jgi:hypothetical protein
MKKYLTFILATSLPLLAQDKQTLNVKPGLWEVTTVTQTTGLPKLPPELLAAVPEAQRAQMMAMFSGKDGEKSAPQKTQQCVTQEDLAKPFDTPSEEHCKAKLITSSATEQQYEMTCAGEVSGKGTMQVSAPDPESMQGKVDIAMSGAAEAVTMQIEMTGKWLGAQCAQKQP